MLLCALRQRVSCPLSPMEITTRDKLVQIVRANPGKYRQSELSRQLGVSRERVRSIVDRLGLHDLVRQHKWQAFCVDCGKRIHIVGGLCRDCWRKKYGAKKVTLVCNNCGRVFQRKESEAKRSEHHFCSRVCLTRYLGVHYGVGAYPERRREKRRDIRMSDLEISVIKKSTMPPRRGKPAPQYHELLRQCANLSDDEALKIKCPTETHADRIVRVVWRRNRSHHTELRAFRKTEPEGIFVYISREAKTA